MSVSVFVCFFFVLRKKMDGEGVEGGGGGGVFFFKQKTAYEITV